MVGYLSVWFPPSCGCLVWVVIVRVAAAVAITNAVFLECNPRLVVWPSLTTITVPAAFTSTPVNITLPPVSIPVTDIRRDASGSAPCITSGTLVVKVVMITGKVLSAVTLTVTSGREVVTDVAAVLPPLVFPVGPTAVSGVPIYSGPPVAAGGPVGGPVILWSAFFGEVETFFPRGTGIAVTAGMPVTRAMDPIYTYIAGGAAIAEGVAMLVVGPFLSMVTSSNINGLLWSVFSTLLSGSFLGAEWGCAGARPDSTGTVAPMLIAGSVGICPDSIPVVVFNKSPRVITRPPGFTRGVSTGVVNAKLGFGDATDSVIATTEGEVAMVLSVGVTGAGSGVVGMGGVNAVLCFAVLTVHVRGRQGGPAYTVPSAVAVVPGVGAVISRFVPTTLP